MLFQYLQLLPQNPGLVLRLLVVTLLSLLVAITVHEASHALIATWQGDRTARAYGRLTLNPLRHLDPLGTIFMFVIGFGWGKPVPVNPFWMKSGPRLGAALVALAGPASNLLVALLLAIPVRLGLAAWHSPFAYQPLAQSTISWIAADLIGRVIFFNVILAIFNLLPIAPLDGFKVALGLLPRDAAESFGRLEPYGPGILMSVILLSYIPLVGFDLWDILGPLVRAVLLVVVGRPL